MGIRGTSNGNGRSPLPPRGGSAARPKPYQYQTKNCKNCGGPTRGVCEYCGTGQPDPKEGVTPTLVRW